MRECSKSIRRRLADASFATRYFVGSGLDVGGKPDPLALYVELFPRVSSVRTWDWEDGDEQFLAGVEDASYDFVHSSHCLEHLVDPRAGIANWFRVLRPGGHLVVIVPDEDLYEQGVFPSIRNRDHKHTFTIWKPESWSPASINLVDLLSTLGPAAELLKIELLHGTYRFGLPRYDQTMSPVAHCAIEFVLNATIDLYAAATITPNNEGFVAFVAADRGHRERYSLGEDLSPDGDLRLHKGVYRRIVREFCAGRPVPLTLSTHSDAPAGS